MEERRQVSWPKHIFALLPQAVGKPYYESRHVSAKFRDGDESVEK
ncbi:MAG: hypothetical protein ABIF85_04160 [Nanoarchaeota archaeon]